ncbi:hypothetical protein G3T36_06400 [Diaminobutyricibacter tongyongensis]|uniref:Uncharacterized protein n=1 Tax=Leifsonia tongyongensis TaxID=1268043 RepID=A0A6L9XWU0_9MICO|nr:hypothetical protein [Diaminobutyricibacter tongyongensis]NEN05498.1 hypothetical protein [Diaminobutyricibacter tongyongensis]
MATRWARVVRGLLAATFATFVAALFHVAGGGATPSALALTLSLTFSGLAALALTGRRASLWRLTASVVVSQTVFHALFSLGSGTTRFVAADGMAHIHAGSHLIAMAGRHMQDSGVIPDSPAMWLSHASAALVTIVALRFGEQAFWGLFETARIRLGRVVRRAVVQVVAVAAPAAVHGDSDAPVLRDLGILIGRMRHRGPPASQLRARLS